MLQDAQTAPEPQQVEAAAENVMTVAKDLRYARYLKMVQVVRHWFLFFFILSGKKKQKTNQCILLHVFSVTGSSCYGYKE